jgi:hypothetical protein
MVPSTLITTTGSKEKRNIWLWSKMKPIIHSTYNLTIVLPKLKRMAAECCFNLFALCTSSLSVYDTMLSLNAATNHYM